jgi:hypothetical protein
LAFLGEQPSFERKEALIEIAAHSIKCLSHTGVSLQDIVNWIKQNFPVMDSTVLFVNNLPISVLLLISAGALNYMKGAPPANPEV